MSRSAVSFIKIVIGLFVCVVLAAIAAVRFGGPSLKRKVFFSLISRTTDPMVLLERRVPAGIHIAYGPDTSQYGELRVPAGDGPFPIAILVHGGCWKARLRQAPPEATSADLLRPLSEALAKTGIATWNIEYRRLGNEGGGWPGSYQDLGSAADSLNLLAPKYHLDLTRTIVIGHSSGGQLAMWLAARRRISSTSPLYRISPITIHGVLDLDGPPDMETASTWDASACNEHVVAQFFGGTPTEVPARYGEGSAAALLPLGVRQEILYSGKTEFMSRNEPQWTALFQSYAVKAMQGGDRVEVVRLDKAGHFDGLNPRSSSWPTVYAKIRELLRNP
ncbi:MAG: alpha/beta hydrolase [Acidobacteriaceae bacterium]|nr:alpha/beta hydrolase [Acidobacteriaceae bacterium]